MYGMMHPKSHTTAQLANLYRRLAKRGMCGAGAARAAYRAAAQLYNGLDRDAAADLQALTPDPKALNIDDANDGNDSSDSVVLVLPSALEDVGASTEDDESDIEATDNKEEERSQERAFQDGSVSAEVATLERRRAAAQSGLLRLYRGWAGMEYSLGCVWQTVLSNRAA